MKQTLFVQDKLDENKAEYDRLFNIEMERKYPGLRGLQGRARLQFLQTTKPSNPCLND